MKYRLIIWAARLVGVWAVLLALLIGAVLIALAGHNPFFAYGELFGGAFFDYWGIGVTLEKISPLLLAGLAVAIPLRLGLFNIGAEGQIYIGGLFATVIALYGPPVPGVLGILLCSVAGMVGGAIWALIPALLKAYRDINEVIVTLLMNFVAINIVNFFTAGPMMEKDAPYPYSPMIREDLWLAVVLPRTDAHTGFVVALVLAIAAYFFFRRTSYGYSMWTVGRSYAAATYAGMSVRRHIVWSMVVGGSIAGLAGSFELLGLNHRLFHMFSDGYGYDGIIIAFLANANALGSAVAATFLAGLESGGGIMERAQGVPSTVIEAIKGLVVMFVAAGVVLSVRQRRWAEMLRRRQSLNESLADARESGGDRERKSAEKE